MQASKIKAEDIQLVAIEDLVPHPKNPHKHTKKQIKRLAKLIKYQGFRVPIIVDRATGYIISGHGRLEAAGSLGFEHLPVIYQDFENDDQVMAYLVSDNAIGKNGWADLDYSMINEFVPELGPDFDMEMLGLENFEIDVPDFEPTSADDQGKLDQKKIVTMECPHCGQTFESDEATIVV